LIAEFIILAAFLAFSIRSIIFIYGASKERNNASNSILTDKPFVSIIVPARDEEKNIRNCILSIEKSKYPIDKFEIIAVNDRSSDKTLVIIEELAAKLKNLKFVNIETDSQKDNLRGKPGAIQAGINIAKGEIILMTDADCLVNELWIETMVTEYADKSVGLVASFTNILGEKIFDKIQAVEWAYLHTLASAGVGLKQPLGCYGNNLSVRKSDYEAVGGYKNISFSVTEDLALLQAIHNSGRKVRYLIHKDSDVDTYPCYTIKEYIKQRHRWAVGGLELGWRAAIFIISSALLILGLITSLAIQNFYYFGFLIISRILWDYWIIGSSFNLLEKKELKKWIPLSVLFFIFYEFFVPFLVLKKRIVWKGQIFEK